MLQWYIIRWQVELVFKRFKALAQLGHLLKYDDESAEAWLYGKFLLARLVEKLNVHAESISLCGYGLEESPATQCVAWVWLPTQPNKTSHRTEILFV